MSIELKGDDSTRTWVHRKNGTRDGYPSSDWDGFMARLECGVSKVNGEDNCTVPGVESATEKQDPNGAKWGIKGVNSFAGAVLGLVMFT